MTTINNEKEEEANIIVNLKLPNKRVYELALGICLLKGYQNLDEFVNDVFLDTLEMYQDGRAIPLEEDVDWGGFKTRDQIKKKEEEKHKEKE